MSIIESNYFSRNRHAERLHLSDLLRGSLIRSIINFLMLPEGSRGVDIGCGIGSNTLMLANAVGRSGHVSGIDLSGSLLAHAREKSYKMGLSQQVSFMKGDMNSLSLSDHCFDWVWSADCVGYAPGNAVRLINNLAGVVKPGGNVFILAWSSQQLLPGYPRLEARLNATSAGFAPFIEGQRPEIHFMRAPGWFRAAGLKEIKAHTFVGNIQAPLTKEKRNAMTSLFEMRWGRPDFELTETERKEYLRLCSPDSPDFICDSPDYYGFFTYTLFRGRTDG
jgi:demethylmenaquinone methyltransferase / 2-methoxy-6-polyprenyl-1,4-benzoquinol methylase